MKFCFMDYKDLAWNSRSPKNKYELFVNFKMFTINEMYTHSINDIIHFLTIADIKINAPGAGSDYAIAFLDSKKQAFDGSKTYKLHIPANVPINNFWAVTMYDTQTRSQLKTDQVKMGIAAVQSGHAHITNSLDPSPHEYASFKT